MLVRLLVYQQDRCALTAVGLLKCIFKGNLAYNIMQPEFWHARWAHNEIAFHEGRVNGLLATHLSDLSLLPGARILVPLCGKTADMIWLCEQGFEVVGCELSALAIDQFFAERALVPDHQLQGHFNVYSLPGLQIWQGDFFALQPGQLGEFDAVYDRAALIAMPADMRQRYAGQLHRVGGGARQLLVTFIYEQAQLEGPPFSVDEAEIARLYGEYMHCRQLACEPFAGGLKGKVPAQEVAWLLSPRGA